MEKEFVPYDIALAIKELGFDEDCLGFWSKIHGLYIAKTIGESKLFEGAGECKAPLYQQVFVWLYKTNNDTVREFYTYTNLRWLIGDIEFENTKDICLRKLIEIVNQNKDELQKR